MKLIRSLFIVLLAFNVVSAFAQVDMQSAEEENPYKATLHVGGAEDFVQAKPVPFEFHLYPAGEFTIDQVKSVINIGNFLEDFYIFELTRREFSPNNQDVFVASGRMVMISVPRKNQVYSVKFMGKPVVVEIRSKEPQKFESKSKEVQFVLIPFISQMSWWEKLLLVIAGIIALTLLGYGIKKLALSLKRKKEHKRRKLKILESFQNAQMRDDYERIYRQREEWITFLGGKNPEAITFLKNIEDVQYKRDWTDDETDVIREKSKDVLKTIEAQ
jgi:hypothetical protein